jgi:hypothetical protein
LRHNIFIVTAIKRIIIVIQKLSTKLEQLVGQGEGEGEGGVRVRVLRLQSLLLESRITKNNKISR